MYVPSWPSRTVHGTNTFHSSSASFKWWYDHIYQLNLCFQIASVASQASLIVANALVTIYTWRATYHTFRLSSKPLKKQSFATVLFTNGISLEILIFTLTTHDSHFRFHIFCVRRHISHTKISDGALSITQDPLIIECYGHGLQPALSTFAPLFIAVQCIILFSQTGVNSELTGCLVVQFSDPCVAICTVRWYYD